MRSHLALAACRPRRSVDDATTCDDRDPAPGAGHERRIGTIDGGASSSGAERFASYRGNRTRQEPDAAPGPHSDSKGASRSAAGSRYHGASGFSQVMVKVTGGGRGMKATAAHFCYISKNGGSRSRTTAGWSSTGKDALKDIETPVALWRRPYRRRQPSPRGVQHHVVDAEEGTDAQTRLKAAREFAEESSSLTTATSWCSHTHQANPHVQS